MIFLASTRCARHCSWTPAIETAWLVSFAPIEILIISTIDCASDENFEYLYNEIQYTFIYCGIGAHNLKLVVCLAKLSKDKNVTSSKIAVVQQQQNIGKNYSFLFLLIVKLLTQKDNMVCKKNLSCLFLLFSAIYYREIYSYKSKTSMCDKRWQPVQTLSKVESSENFLQGLNICV